MSNDLEPLAFEVESVTSEHSAHPASELLERESGNGWQSSPLSDELLQDIVLRLRDGPCAIHTIELLAHEYLIPQKIEITIASNYADNDSERVLVDPAQSFDECANIRKLGYVAFSQNAESNYSARELKTVSLGGQKANFVKLRLHSPHPNELNVHNQVALVGLELIGHSASSTRKDGSSDQVVDMSQVNDLSEAKEEEKEEEEEEENMDEQQEDSREVEVTGDSAATGGARTSDACTGSVRSTTGNSNTSTSNYGDDEELSSSDTSKPSQSQPALDSISSSASKEVPDAKTKVPSTIAISSSEESRPLDSLHTVSPSSSPSLSNPLPSAQEFTERRKRTNDEVHRRLDKLDQIKLKLAAVEDFEKAARIKVVVDEAKKSISKLNNLETCMRLASEKEDYSEAMNLKSQRDTARVEAMHSLEVAESSVVKIIGRNDRLIAPEEVKVQLAREDPIAEATSPPPGGHRSTYMRQNTEIYEHCTETSNQADAERDSARVCDKPMPPKPFATGDDSAQNTATPACFVASPYDKQGNGCDSDSFSIDSAAATSKLHHDENTPDVEEEYNEDNHPLKGVTDYMALPAPENINNEGEGIATDIIARRIESLVGSYITKCFFSKNYALREAALAKVSLMLPEMGQQQQDEMYSPVKDTVHPSSYYLRTCCIMLERAMNDRVIPVFVASLLLLDDCISEFEQSGMTSKEVLSHLSVITPCLVSHLGDGKNKVVEGAETALLSMALSQSIGPACISHLLTKRTYEMRTARAIIARMKVAQVSRLLLLPGNGGTPRL